jgi:hypothetical protein
MAKAASVSASLTIAPNVAQKRVWHNNHSQRNLYDHYDLGMNSTANRFSVLIRVDRKAGRGEFGLCSAALATQRFRNEDC